MSEPALLTHLKQLRTQAGLSQQGLALQVGATRQAILAVESGRQVPSTRLALALARALACAVEDLFELPAPALLRVQLVQPPPQPGTRAGADRRVLLGQVRGAWVAHPLDGRGSRPADAVLVPQVGAGQAWVEPLEAVSRLSESALVAGCAPLLGLLSQRADRARAGAGWIRATSGEALELLARGQVHVAGLHGVGSDGEHGNAAAVLARFPDQPMVLVNLTRWRQGLVLPPGNPLGLRGAADLTRPGLRLACRSEGAGATRLLRSLLGDAMPAGPFAAGHGEVAQLVRLGAADAGVAIEAVALAAGLAFVPLSQERFDLVVPRDLVDHPGVVQLVDALGGRAFRTEAAHIPGYDQALAGHASTVEAA